ncbi:MAG: TspO/MBR family protein [Planctomycetota bacterium]|jgi:tryptophan-rich sensory protein
MRLPEAAKLVVCLGLTFSAAVLGSLFTGRHGVSGWYANLNKPFFTPPDWVFGPVWTVLYIFMAISAFLVWQRGFGSPFVKVGLGLYLVQLVLNALWPPIFFGLQMPLLAFIEILLLWLGVLLTSLAFAQVSAGAALLLLPYLVWVTFAAVLNGGICLLNR